MAKASTLLLVLPVAFLSLPANALARRANSDLTKDGLPNIKSAAALVIDLASSEVLYERDADAVRPIASISKVVGALVVQEECNLKPDDLHVMSVANREAAKGGDKTRLTTGWAYSHSDLLHAALMRSDNRALPALAEACGLTAAQLGERMTARVRKLGLNKTFFREPNGLSPENVSTPREVVLFLQEAVKIPAISRIMTTSEHVITAHKDGRKRPIKIRNTDRLLSKNVATILGGKTGYTDLARYCFAVAAETQTGRKLGMVFLGAEGRHTRFADFGRVLRWLSAPESTIASGARPGEAAPRNAASGQVKAAGFVGGSTIIMPSLPARSAGEGASTPMTIKPEPSKAASEPTSEMKW